MFEKVLVTGVTGFVGSHCAVALLQEGYDVIGIDNYDNSYVITSYSIHYTKLYELTKLCVTSP